MGVLGSTAVLTVNQTTRLVRAVVSQHEINAYLRDLIIVRVLLSGY